MNPANSTEGRTATGRANACRGQIPFQRTTMPDHANKNAGLTSAIEKVERCANKVRAAADDPVEQQHSTAKEEKELRTTIEMAKEVAEVAKSIARHLAKSCTWLESDGRGVESAQKSSTTKSWG